MMRPFIKNLLALIFSTLFFLVLLELGVRLLNQQMGHYPQKDPILHHSLIPKAKLKRTNNEFDVTYEINSQGLRDREIPLEKPANTYRILMLGDSYTFGIGNNLEDTFSKRLEKKLNFDVIPAKVGISQVHSGDSRLRWNDKSQNIHYEVINGGCSSYAPILEYLFLIHKGLKLHPDLVILNYDISDVQDDHKYSQIAEFDEKGLPLKVNPIDVQYYYREIKKGYKSSIPYLEQSELYQFIISRIYQVKGNKEAPQFYQEAQIVAGNIEYDRDLPVREKVGDWKKYFDESARYLQMIHQLLQSKNIQLVITSYPYGTLVNEKEWKIGRKLRGFDEKVYSTNLFDYLAEFSKSEKIPFLNMTPDFKASKEFPLFYSYDGHFTPAGHEVAAKSLEKFLLEKRLIPIDPTKHPKLPITK